MNTCTEISDYLRNLHVSAVKFVIMSDIHREDYDNTSTGNYSQGSHQSGKTEKVLTTFSSQGNQGKTWVF